MKFCRAFELRLVSLFPLIFQNLESLRHRFITAKPTEGTEPGTTAEGEEDEVYGDFEDLETGETTKAPPTSSDDPTPDAEALALEKKKAILKQKFDAEYDGSDDEANNTNIYETMKEDMARQQALNREEFEGDDEETRALVEGYRPGLYVRIVLEGMPCEFIENFDPIYPVVVGGLLSSEEGFGFMQVCPFFFRTCLFLLLHSFFVKYRLRHLRQKQVRIKRHRWHKKILKTNDPLIFSLGWRRFQSIPIYSLDDRIRNRMLKYTPEHMHCLATIYGPITPPNTGFCSFQSVSEVSVSSMSGPLSIVVVKVKLIALVFPACRMDSELAPRE